MSDESAPKFSGESGVKEVHAGLPVQWDLQLSSGYPKAKITITVSSADSENAPEWSVSLLDSTGSEIWDNYRSKPSVDVDLPGSKDKILQLQVICPKGARYDDSVTVTIAAENEGGESSVEFGAVARQSVVILKTQINQEDNVAMSLIAKASQGEEDIYAVLSPIGLRGYVFVEGMNTDRLHEKTRDIRKARAFIDGEVSIAEISHYMTPVSAVVGIEEGDFVELVNGPFKGERAIVTNIDEVKEDITVELVEAMVPIPVTVKGDSVRVIEKEM